MALTNRPKTIIASRTLGGDVASLVVITNGQSFKKGAPVINSSGKFVESTSPVAGTNKCLGIAQHDASTATGDKDLLYLTGKSEQLFEVSLSDSTAGTHTLAQTDLYLTYPITKDPTFSTGIWYLDANGVTADGGTVVEFKDPVGTVDGRVLMRITPGAVKTAAGVQQY